MSLHRGSGPTDLFIELDRSGVLGEQIGRQIRLSIAQGHLVPGERLPSLRRLARELNVSVDTVLEAYRLLCDEGLVRSRRGAGFFVCQEDTSSFALRSAELGGPERAGRAPSAHILEKTHRVRREMAADCRSAGRTPLATYPGNCKYPKSDWICQDFSRGNGRFMRGYEFKRGVSASEGLFLDAIPPFPR